MNKLKEILKFHILPKKLYLRYSAQNKYHRADKSEESELRLLPEIVDKNKTAIDIGANTGLYTYFLARYAKQVIAFEPHTLFSEFLSKAVADNVAVINKAVSNKNSQVPFYIPVRFGREQMNIASLDRPGNAKMTYHKRMINTVTLDSMQIENVGYIKIDVEGHEYEVLQGAQALLTQQRPVIQIEILGKPEEKLHNRSLELLMDHEYEIYVYLDNELKKMNSVSPAYFGKNFICLSR